MLVFSFVEQAPVDGARLLALVQTKVPAKKSAPPPIRLTPDGRLVVPCGAQENVFVRITSILQSLQGATS